MAVRGVLDPIDGYTLRGWAIDDDSTEAVRVDILIDGVTIATVPCKQFRADLAEAGIGSGNHAFSYAIPCRYVARPSQINVRLSGGGPCLTNGDIQYEPDPAFSRFLSTALAKGAWRISEIQFTNNSILIEGWAIPPGAVPIPSALTHNGKPITDVEWYLSDHVAHIPGIGRDDAGFGFRARQDLEPNTRNHEFNFVHAQSRHPFDPNQSIHYMRADEPLAPEPLRSRVNGRSDAESFVRLGSSAFVRLERTVEAYFSRKLGEFPRILDWGCGCGRIFRYFDETLARGTFTGVDVDHRAVKWCKQTYPGSEFFAVGPNPPMTLPDEAFDLIYGISVMTHLRELDHLWWLKELWRLSKPNGVVLLSTMGETSFWRGKLPWSLFGKWNFDHKGFLDTGTNQDLGDLDIEADYYRNVFISRDYILRKWTSYFEVLDVLPGAIANTQDLVILQKRS